ncbi:MAG: hypothetical protein H6581_25075 [Bacteroidia bacterium]|nr:hypothetical protein [Bacteroidia bacterium]
MNPPQNPSFTSTSQGAVQIPEPVISNQYQDFSDLPSLRLRKGIDDEGNPWSPDILLVRDGQAGTAANWAREQFAGRAFGRDFTGDPQLSEVISGEDDFWVIRMENLKSRRKLLTIRLYAAPAGFEDEALAWTPMDKFLFEIEPRQQAAVARKVNLQALGNAWSRRRFFEGMALPHDLAEVSDNPAWIFVAVVVTDAELDHPENVCHCGSVQACNATAEGLDRRDPRYPFERVFRHSIRSTFPLQEAVGMRMYRVAGC